MQLAGLLTDFRYAARLLVRNKSFTVVAALTLGVGIGASVALFSVVDAVLWRPLPYGQPGTLVKLWERRTHLAKGRVSWADYADWKAQTHAFDALAAYRAG